MKKIKYKSLAVMLCFILALALFPFKTLGAVRVDKESKCSLKIAFMPEGIKASGVNFKAYKVASVTDSYNFSVEPFFAKQEVTKLLNNPTAESYRLVASTLSGIIASESTINPDYTAVSDSSGITSFEDINVGLYLIIGEVYKGEYAYYTPQNFMVSLPKLNGNDLWDYDVFSDVKWEKRIRNDILNLEALKVWSDSATNLHTKDFITVELYENGSLYDTKILNKDNNWRCKWNNLKNDSSWEIKERGINGYIGTVEKNGDCFIITNTPKKQQSTPDVIPQTGLLLWPVPVLYVGGILFILIGIYVKRKGEK